MLLNLITYWLQEDVHEDILKNGRYEKCNKQAGSYNATYTTG